jgi:hypothetical protein
VFGPPGDHALRQCRTDSRQAGDFAHVSMIQIDALAGKERASKLRRASCCLAQPAWLDGR